MPSTRRIVTALALFVLLESMAVAGLNFSKPRKFSVSNLPDGIAVGDFNHDGKLDVAVSSCNAVSLSVFLGNGNGTFQPAATYDAGPDANSLLTGDFNRDGNLDLAVISGTGLNLLLGNGDGTFQMAKVSPAGNVPNSLVAGDFNGDGKLDLAVSNYCLDRSCDSYGGYTILIGRGDGTFRPMPSVQVSGNPIELVAADFNRDGAPDLAISGTSLFVLLADGDGTFQSPVTLGMGSTVAATDLNHDGNLDLIATDGNVAVLLGNGDGTFQAGTDFAGGSDPWGIKAGDFNGDGKMDVVVITLGGTSVEVLLGNGDGTLQAPTSFSVGQQDPDFVAIGDFNGDRRKDLAIVANDGASSNYLSVLLNLSTAP